MLPNLNRLTLDTGGGFHLVTDDDQKRFADEGTFDPATLEPPGELWSFRVESEVPNSDGTPRHVQFTASSLWRWVKTPSNNGTFPSGTGQRILYEDWWRLHKTFDGTPPSDLVLSYVNALEREAAFKLRVLRARSTILHKIALVQASVLTLPETRAGPMTEATWVRWRFWLRRPNAAEIAQPDGAYTESGALALNSTASVDAFLKYIQDAFKDLWLHMHLAPGPFRTATYSTGGILKDGDMACKVVDTTNPEGWRNLRQVVFAVRAESLAPPFLEYVNASIALYGFSDFIRRAHGLEHAFGGGGYFECAGDLPHQVSPEVNGTSHILPTIPKAQSNTNRMLFMTTVRYNTHRAFLIMPHRHNPSGHYPQTPDPADQSTEFPPPRVLSIRWLFWLKPTPGRWPGADEFSKMMKKVFHMRMTKNHSNLTTGPENQRRWSSLLAIEIFEEDVGVRPREEGVASSGQPAIECMCKLELPQPQAAAFLKMCEFWNRSGDPQAPGQKLYRDLFDQPSSKTGNPAIDLPRESAQREFGPRFSMSLEAYESWGELTLHFFTDEAMSSDASKRQRFAAAAVNQFVQLNEKRALCKTSGA